MIIAGIYPCFPKVPQMFATKIRKLFSAAAMFLLLNSDCYPQQTSIPSLHQKLVEQQQHVGFETDTAYINTLDSLSKSFYSLNADSMRLYASKALELSKKAKYPRGQAASLRLLGSSYYLTSDPELMLGYYQEALTIAEKINDPHLTSKIISNIGFYYSSMGRYNEALTNIKKAYQLELSTKNPAFIASSLSDLGDIYSELKNYDSALLYNFKALEIAKKINDPYIEAFVSSSIGKVYFATKNYQEALGYFVPSYRYYIATKNMLGKIHTSILIAQTYEQLKKKDSAIVFAKQALEMARSIKIKREIMDAAKILASSYEQKKNTDSALLYFKIYKTYSDSVYNDNIRQKAFVLETKYAYEKKEQAIKEEQARKDLITTNKLEKHRQQIIFAIVLMLLLGILAAGLFVSWSNKKKANLLLNEKNIEIGKQKEAIEIQAKELQINNQLKDKLFSVVSHDLRSPLNSLKGLLDLWKLKKISVNDMEMFIGSLSKDVNNTYDLVTNLFLWANNQKNGIAISPATVPIHIIIDSTFALFTTQSFEKQLYLTNAVPSNTFAFADKDMVQAVFRNLVSNAIKFCKPKDTISIQLTKSNEKMIEICVSDTGAGIKKDILDKILSNQSVTTYGTQNEKGTGLGLLLCKEFIEKNGGKFWITSEVGKGSSFYFTLPAPQS